MVSAWPEPPSDKPVEESVDVCGGVEAFAVSGAGTKRQLIRRRRAWAARVTPGGLFPPLRAWALTKFIKVMRLLT
ncbi:MAG TPA: hypothetical protein VKK81_15365 [Candidatus Binatia bacterium]|nr:hypothetical protein [Candidatus Binatia bacterium]